MTNSANRPTLSDIYSNIAQLEPQNIQNSTITQPNPCNIQSSFTTSSENNITETAENTEIFIENSSTSIVKCTYHYLQRFSERIARKSRRRLYFAEQAYLHGINSEDVKNCHLRNFCRSREISYSAQAKIYHGFIYWFCDNIAITVYRLPKEFRNVIH